MRRKHTLTPLGWAVAATLIGLLAVGLWLYF